MNFKDHSRLEGQHAFLGASQYHWINYSEEKLEERLSTYLATLKGTELHEFAANAIRLKIKLPRTQKTLARKPVCSHPLGIVVRDLRDESRDV